MPAAELSFTPPETAEDWAALAQLTWDYRAHLLSLPAPFSDLQAVVYSADKVERILAQAPVDARPPLGSVRLVQRDGRAVGCGWLGTFSPGTAVIRRVYLAPGARGLGAGRALMDHLIADARTLGFRRIVMDTGAEMATAQALYDSLGFRRRGPFEKMSADTEALLVFYEMDL
ncbi:MAG: GNAT family N-acetyltransferase [Pseudomonadota bacterium]